MQCGFCTPGIILTTLELLERHPAADREQRSREALGGHICRCTGYVKIVEAIEEAARRLAGQASLTAFGGVRSSARRIRGSCAGEGRYVADLKLHGMTHAAVLRSHARPRASCGDRPRRRAAATRACSTCVVGADVADLPHILCIDAEETTRPFTQPLLAGEKVRYVGEPVAMVVVEGDRYDAEDVLALIDVDYEPLPAVDRRRGGDGARTRRSSMTRRTSATSSSTRPATANGDRPGAAPAPTPVHDPAPRRHADRDPRLPRRLRPTPRSARRVRTSTQTPHGVKRGLAYHLGLPESAIRVVAPDVGGGFGVKLQIYPEEVLVCLLARRLRRPVKWIEDRWEHFVATTHGREQFHEIEVGYDDDGIVVGVRDHAVTDTGAYLARLTLVEPVHRRRDAARARTGSRTSRRPRRS